jgi:hypothetical protein
LLSSDYGRAGRQATLDKPGEKKEGRLAASL